MPVVRLNEFQITKRRATRCDVILCDWLCKRCDVVLCDWLCKETVLCLFKRHRSVNTVNGIEFF